MHVRSGNVYVDSTIQNKIFSAFLPTKCTIPVGHKVVPHICRGSPTR